VHAVGGYGLASQFRLVSTPLRVNLLAGIEQDRNSELNLRLCHWMREMTKFGVYEFLLPHVVPPPFLRTALQHDMILAWQIAIARLVWRGDFVGARSRLAQWSRTSDKLDVIWMARDGIERAEKGLDRWTACRLILVGNSEWSMSFYRAVDSVDMMMHCAVHMGKTDPLPFAEAALARGYGEAALEVSRLIDATSPRQRGLIERALDVGVRRAGARAFEVGFGSRRARTAILGELQSGDAAVMPTYARLLMQEGDRLGALRVIRKAEMNVRGEEEIDHWLECAKSWALIDGRWC
jgi:hypothetical protein